MGEAVVDVLLDFLGDGTFRGTGRCGYGPRDVIIVAKLVFGRGIGTLTVKPRRCQQRILAVSRVLGRVGGSVLLLRVFSFVLRGIEVVEVMVGGILDIVILVEVFIVVIVIHIPKGALR